MNPQSGMFEADNPHQHHLEWALRPGVTPEALAAAAVVAARRKRAKYPNCPVIPFVVEDHGRLGEEAVSKAREEVDSVLKQESPRPTENYYGQAIGYCELCQEERLVWDLNEDGRCHPCEEREEKNENGI